MQELVEQVISKIQNLETRGLAYNVLDELCSLYANDRDVYRKKILYGQKIIWNEIVICFHDVMKLSNDFKKQNFIFYKDSYLKAKDQVKKMCELYSLIHVRVSRLEDVLGIDRYLDTIVSDEIEPLERLLEEQKRYLEFKCNEYKELFQYKWNTTNVVNIIKHKILAYDSENEICYFVTSGSRKGYTFRY